MAKAPANKTPPKKAETTAVAAPAPRKPLTVQEQRKAIQADMLTGVMERREDLERFLKPQGIAFDFFYAGLQVALMNTSKQDAEFFGSVTPESFFTAVYKGARDGLICDGREAAIARFGSEATYMPMVAGFVKKAHQTGMIASITTGVVTEEEWNKGDFEYEEGDDGFIRHRPSLLRKDTDTIVAAYAIVKTTNGGVYREVVPKADLEKMAAMSKATKGPRKDWKLEMHRKGALRRVFKLIPHNKELAQLLQHDEETYLPAPRHETQQDRPQVSTAALFAREPEHVAPDEGETGDLPPPEEPVVEEVKIVEPEKVKRPPPADPVTAPNQGVLIDQMMKLVKDTTTPGELAAAIDDLRKHPHRGDLTANSERIVAQAINDQQEKLGVKPKSDPGPATQGNLI